MVLASKQGGDVETREPQTRGLSINSIGDSLSLNFLVYFSEISNYFSMKTKEKLGNTLKAWTKSRDKTKTGKEIIW